VLICPTCQSSYDWMAELDRCPVCLSVHLVRRLGEVECRDCGYVRDPSAVGAEAVTSVPAGLDAPGSLPDFGQTPGLAEEVELALDRVLGKARRPAGIA